MAYPATEQTIPVNRNGVKTATPTTMPGGGSNPLFDENSVAGIIQNPGYALAAIQQARGGRDKSGKLGTYRDSQLAKALQAYFSMIGQGGVGAGMNPLEAARQGMGQMMGNLNAGQGIGGFLRQNASSMLNGNGAGVPGVNMANMDNDQIMDILGLASGAANYGLGPMAQYGSQNALADLNYEADKQALAGGGTTAVLNSGGGADRMKALIAQYLALR